MNKILTIFAAFVCFAACHTAKEKAGALISKAGETVGSGATEFVKGVGKGIDEVLGAETDFSGIPKEEGLQTGKVIVADSAGHANVISVYFIFNKDFSKEISVRVVDKAGREYGRAHTLVAGKKGDAGFYDFYFPGRTDFESKSKFYFE